MLHKVSIAGLTMDPASNTPIIILKSEETEQAIPIWIGLLEATSIASALQKIQYERPMTHDLFKNFSDLLSISISKIEVCDLKDNTFYAKIYFISKEGKFEMDSRIDCASFYMVEFLIFSAFLHSYHLPALARFQ